MSCSCIRLAFCSLIRSGSWGAAEPSTEAKDLVKHFCSLGWGWRREEWSSPQIWFGEHLTMSRPQLGVDSCQHVAPEIGPRFFRRVGWPIFAALLLEARLLQRRRGSEGWSVDLVAAVWVQCSFASAVCAVYCRQTWVYHSINRARKVLLSSLNGRRGGAIIAGLSTFSVLLWTAVRVVVVWTSTFTLLICVQPCLSGSRPHFGL
jgi:hypothetical protein